MVPSMMAEGQRCGIGESLYQAAGACKIGEKRPQPRGRTPLGTKGLADRHVLNQRAQRKGPGAGPW